MKVIFSHNVPFFLAHGGTQTLIQSLMRELGRLGLEVEPERWWDEKQQGDVLHYVGRPPSVVNVRLAKQKGFKVVMTDLLDQTASRSAWALLVQRTLIRLTQKLLPGFTNRLAWEVYQELDAIIYAVAHEWDAAQYLFNATPSRGHVIPHGLEEEALSLLKQPAPAGDYLISIATIAPRKNTLLLAEAARRAEVPVVFLGKPYAEDDDYFRRFRQMVDDRLVRYPGFVSIAEKFKLLRSARGFVLLSQFESGCIAVHEAAAAGLPLLLSKLPWAIVGYQSAEHKRLIPLGSVGSVAEELKLFYTTAARLEQTTFPVLSWRQVAEKYREIYTRVLNS